MKEQGGEFELEAEEVAGTESVSEDPKRRWGSKAQELDHKRPYKFQQTLLT